MINRFSTKTLFSALAVLVLLWLLLSGQAKKTDRSQNIDAHSVTLVSAIQPISEVNAAPPVVGVASGSLNFRANENQSAAFNNDDLARLQSRFDTANMAIESGQLQTAVTGLEALTVDFPSVIEPYLNLASIYAEQQQLEKARATLLKGFDANPKAGMLFDHLKKVHGALAASSYRQALDTNGPNALQAKLALGRASSIVTQLDQSNKIAALEKQLQDSQSKVDAAVNASQSNKVLALEAKLIDTEVANSAAKSAYDSELNGLKTQLAGQSQVLLLSQTAEREALARVVRAEQDASNKIAEITSELELQKTSLLAVQALASQQSDALAKAKQQSLAQQQGDAERDAENIRLAKQVADQAAASAAGEVSVVNESLGKRELEQAAAGLVQSWAKAWSAQDVTAYVGHYADSYSSSRSITRAQWLEQRQVRLTNKQYINVNVSGFKTKDLGAQFSVTFSQYYQSNTVDDTVTKRLIFNKNGDDLSLSKIINERLVSN